MNTKSQDNNYIVYKHTAPNGKVYIGITCKNPLDRWASGFGYEHQVYFFRAIVKYGWINMKHEVLYEVLTKEEAQAKEIELIAKYKSADLNYGYNIDLGGDLHKLSIETRKRISDKKKGKKWTERQRLASLEYFAKFPGKPVNKYDKKGNLVAQFKSCKEACLDAGITYKTFQGYISTKRFPAKWEYVYSYGTMEGVMQKAKKLTYNVQPVDMYDLSLNLLKVFPSIEEAKRYLKKNNIPGGAHIWDVCNGKRLISGNYIWRYHHENQDNESTE